MVKITIDVPDVVIAYIDQYRKNEDRLVFTLKLIRQGIISMESNRLQTVKRQEMETIRLQKEQELLDELQAKINELGG